MPDRIPPLPGPLNTTERLRVGDVVMIALELEDKRSGEPFWWRRFAVVTKLRKYDKLRFEALNLKLERDPDKDLREIDLRPGQERRQVVTYLPEPSWPQGVAGIYMKLLATRVITIEGED